MVESQLEISESELVTIVHNASLVARSLGHNTGENPSFEI